MSSLTYFAAADRQMENFLDQDAFEKSLLLNVLFQPGLLIPDIFCFISHGLEKHVFRFPSKQSLFEACLAGGVIAPTFRDGATSFIDALELIQGKGEHTRAIQGVLSNAKDMAQRLQVAADYNQSFKPISSPKYDVGKSYKEIIMSHLSTSNPPLVSKQSVIKQHEFDRIWEITYSWRTSCVDEACKRTESTTDFLSVDV